MPITAYLNIGSNKGDRRALIGQAVALLSCAFPRAGVRLSEWVESEPWGYSSEHMFLNLGVALDFADGEAPEPLSLLSALQAVERRVSPGAHRNPDGSYRDRGLDIDIIAIDLQRLHHPRLQLPHPRAHLRPFVMEPLRQLAPPGVLEIVKQG